MLPNFLEAGNSLWVALLVLPTEQRQVIARVVEPNVTNDLWR